jgi:CMP-N-acetylneuraminic acid synthetase
LKTLALIPARGGSKGIPRKNIKPMAGKPLIAWTIEAALNAQLVDAVVVSTDDAEIAEISRQWKAQIPFMRPPELAQDDTPGIDPVLHALDKLPGYDAVLLLQPTSPLRTAADIDACIRLAHSKQAPSVVSVCEPEQHPYWMYKMDPELGLASLIDVPAFYRRQDLPAVYALNGALYYAHADWLRAHRSFEAENTVGYVMPRERSVDIDTLLDWKIAELLITERM